MDILSAIADERRRVAGLLDFLTPEQLDTPSLCGAWTVRQVAGHLVSTIVKPGRPPLSLIARSGFRPHLANARYAVLMAERPPAELARILRDNADNPSRPPVVGFLAPLTELQVHGQDIRRPLGLPHGLLPERLRVSLDFLTSGRALGFTPRRRVAGLRFEASDLGWSWGEGPVVSGAAEALLLAITGRGVALGELAGPGVSVLRGRLG